MGLCSLLQQTLVQYVWLDVCMGTIMAKELVPIVLDCAVWGPLLAKGSTVFQCDNHGLVQAINKDSSRDLMVMRFSLLSLICRSWLYTYLEQQTTLPMCCLETKPHSFLGDILRPTNTTTFTSPAHCVTIKTKLDFLFKESLAQIQHLADQNS